jgi:type 1 glutamine amidotransferase
MKNFGWWVVMLAAGLGVAAAQTQKPAKILFVVGGEYHDYDQLPKTLTEHLSARLKDSDGAEFTITKDLSVLRKPELSKYDLLMMNVCEQTPLSADEKEGFLDAVRDGLPVVALHCTFWSFQAWPEFKQVLGAFVPGHGHFGSFCVEAASVDSPILKGVAPSFEITDEPYIVNERDPAMQVIVRTCKSVEDRPGTEPEVWTKTYSKGRIFAMTFGHDGRAQENPNYLRLLTNGILWALGRSN